MSGVPWKMLRRGALLKLAVATGIVVLLARIRWSDSPSQRASTTPEAGLRKQPADRRQILRDTLASTREGGLDVGGNLNSLLALFPELRPDGQTRALAVLGGRVVKHPGCQHLPEARLRERALLALGSSRLLYSVHADTGDRRVAKVVNGDCRGADCQLDGTLRLLKEVVLLHLLRHDSLPRLVGYCFRSAGAGIAGGGLSGQPALALYEAYTRIDPTVLAYKTWSVRLRIARWLASLLNYMEHSPLGSLLMGEFKSLHFQLGGGGARLVLTDLADLSAREPDCTPRRTCPYGLRCSSDGACPGFNARRNLERATELLFNILLDTSKQHPYESKDPILNSKIEQIKSWLDTGQLVASELETLLVPIIAQQVVVEEQWREAREREKKADRERGKLRIVEHVTYGGGGGGDGGGDGGESSDN